MAPQRFLLLVRFIASSTTVTHPIVIEDFKVAVLLEVRGVEHDACNTDGVQYQRGPKIYYTTLARSRKKNEKPKKKCTRN